MHILYDRLISLEIVKQNQNVTSPQTAHLITKAKECLYELKLLSENAPSNFINKFHLMQAEMLVVLDDTKQANMHYQEAIRLSEKYGFVHEQALACERAGIFLLQQYRQSNSPFSAKAATQLFITSHKCYETWGAIEKAKDLKAKYLSDTKWDPSSALLNTSIEVDNGSQDSLSFISDNSSGIANTRHIYTTASKKKKRRKFDT